MRPIVGATIGLVRLHGLQSLHVAHAKGPEQEPKEKRQEGLLYMHERHEGGPMRGWAMHWEQPGAERLDRPRACVFSLGHVLAWLAALGGWAPLWSCL